MVIYWIIGLALIGRGCLAITIVDDGKFAEFVLVQTLSTLEFCVSLQFGFCSPTFHSSTLLG